MNKTEAGLLLVLRSLKKEFNEQHLKARLFYSTIPRMDGNDHRYELKLLEDFCKFVAVTVAKSKENT